jgi:hypothetical protein
MKASNGGRVCFLLLPTIMIIIRILSSTHFKFIKSNMINICNCKISEHCFSSSYYFYYYLGLLINKII